MVPADNTGNSALPGLLSSPRVNDNANQARTSAAIVKFNALNKSPNQGLPLPGPEISHFNTP